MDSSQELRGVVVSFRRALGTPAPTVHIPLKTSTSEGGKGRD